MKYAWIGGVIGALVVALRMAATDSWPGWFRRLFGRGLKNTGKE
jgi:hypothetical protein